MAQMSIPILVDWESIKDYLAKSDIVEVVRCKDCKHRQQYDCNNITLGGTKCGVTDDWFCADGERSEDADDIPMEYFENGGI